VNDLMKYKSIFLVIFFFWLSEIENFADEIENKQSYTYKICKRPLKPENQFLQFILNPVLKVIDIPYLEKEYLNPYHFHFFRISNKDSFVNYKKMSMATAINTANFIYEQKIYEQYTPTWANRDFVQESCRKNNFKNFGFFEKSEIRCDENITDYEVCSTEVFDDNDLRSSLEILMKDFSNHTYELTSYNCQLFAKNLFDIYDSFQVNHSPVCVPIKYSNESLINRIFSSIFSSSNNTSNKILDSLSWSPTYVKWGNKEEEICRIQ
jgi:hypothetical protein